MSIPEAFKGARVELAGLSNPWQRLVRVFQMGGVFADALLGTLLMVPYGYRALHLHRTLPDHSAISALHSRKQHQQRTAAPVSIVRDVRYGPMERNTLDVYVPPPGMVAAAAGQGDTTGGQPVCVFTHGGVWATGEKWQYAPMAHRLAQAGVLTVVLQYSLYPAVLVPHQIAELSLALSWAMDNVPRYGGDSKKISLVGHSAGAQMCAMALLRRAAAAGDGSNARNKSSVQQQQQQRQRRQPVGDVALGGSGGGSRADADATTPPSTGLSYRKGAAAVGAAASAAVVVDASWSGPETQSGSLPAAAASFGDDASTVYSTAFNDGRMPAHLIGMAGVYDIAKHYEYEQGRGVHELSTMKRAMGGYRYFASQSPALLLARALRRERGDYTDKGSGKDIQDEVEQLQPRPFHTRFGLRGEAISHRIGTERSWSDMLREVSAADDKDEAREAGCPGVRLEHARRLPPTLLMSSCTDLTVPWYSSAEMFWMVHDCGVPAKNLVYDKIDHGTFVTGWTPRPEEKEEANNGGAWAGGNVDMGDDLPPCCADLLRVVSGVVPVQWCNGSGSDTGPPAESGTAAKPLTGAAAAGAAVKEVQGSSRTELA